MDAFEPPMFLRTIEHDFNCLNSSYTSMCFSNEGVTCERANELFENFRRSIEIRVDGFIRHVMHCLEAPCLKRKICCSHHRIRNLRDHYTRCYEDDKEASDETRFPETAVDAVSDTRLLRTVKRAYETFYKDAINERSCLHVEDVKALLEDFKRLVLGSVDEYIGTVITCVLKDVEWLRLEEESYEKYRRRCHTIPENEETNDCEPSAIECASTSSIVQEHNSDEESVGHLNVIL